MGIKIKISSRSGNTKKRIQSILKSGLGGAQQAMNQYSSEVKDRSQELVPKDTGKLHDSAYAIGKGYVDADAGDAAFVTNRIAQLNTKKGPQSEVGYSADYAMQVHEDLEAVHPNGQAKFLEQASRQSRKQLSKKAAKGMSNGMKRVQ